MQGARAPTMAKCSKLRRLVVPQAVKRRMLSQAMGRRPAKLRLVGRLFVNPNKEYRLDALSIVGIDCELADGVEHRRGHRLPTIWQAGLWLARLRLSVLCPAGLLLAGLGRCGFN